MVRGLTMAEAVDMPIGAPTRFKVGDRVECRCGEAWYPATVVEIWYTPTKDEFPYDTKMPYRCELDSGQLVWAPLDHEGCVRAAAPPPPPRAHIIRKKPSVSLDILDKMGLNQTCCSEPNCNCEDGPMPVYFSLNGQAQFTGMVRYGKHDVLDDSSVVGTGGGIKIVRLDDADGPLDGPGHVMDDDEIMCEYVHYDGGSCGPGSTPPEGWLSPPFKNLRDKEASLLRDGELDPRYGVDETFPFDVLDDGSLRASVRADDEVKVIYERDQPLPLLRKIMGQPPQPGDVDDEGRPVMAPTKDRQWLEVVAVTRQGIVTARPSRQPGEDFCFKFSPELTPDKFCYFPCDRILAMKKYSNW